MKTYTLSTWFCIILFLVPMMVVGRNLDQPRQNKTLKPGQQVANANELPDEYVSHFAESLSIATFKCQKFNKGQYLTHFPWSNNGDPGDNTWGIFIDLATLNGVNLKPGDELAIFDGEKIVGGEKLETVPVPGQFLVSITAYKTLVNGPGYAPGNVATFKMWDSETNNEITICSITFLYPDYGFWMDPIFPVGSSEFSCIELNCEDCIYPPEVYAGEDATITNINSYILADAVALNYSALQWSTSGDGVFNDETIENPIYIPGIADFVNCGVELCLTANPIDPCSITATDCMILNLLPAAAAGADRSICLGTSTTLGATAVSGSTYSWTSVPVGFTSTAANPSVSPLVTTTYTVTETITATGCSKSNSVVVTVNPLPAAAAGANRSICLGTSTTLGAAAVSGSTYSWTSVPVGFTSTAANPSVSPLVTTTYTVTETITATGCSKSNSVVVTVNPLPAAAAGANRSICLGTSTTLGAAAVSGSTYSWTSVPVGFTSTAANPSVSPLVTTTYTVTETITATGCNNTNSVVVTITPTVGTPLFALGATSTRCQGAGSVTYTATATNTTGITYTLDAASITGGNSIVAGTGAVTYVAGWSGTSIITASAAGCNGPSTATHTVTITPIVGTPLFALGATSTRCQGAGSVTYTATATNTTGITYTLDAASITGGNSIVAGTGAVTYVAGWSGTSIITASAAGCNGPSTATHTVTITPIVGTPLFALGATSTRCQGAGSVTYTATATNTTGITYTLDAASITGGNSIVAGTGAVTYVAGWSGTSIITASAAGCNGPSTATHTVTINVLPAVAFDSIVPFCQNSPPYQLTEGSPAGGVYSGPTVVNGWFYPEDAGVGIHLLTYTFTDNNGCVDSANRDVTVQDCTAIGALSGKSVSVFPNPGDGNFIVQFNGNTESEFLIKIYNSTGKLLLERTIDLNDDHKTAIDLTSHPKGLYYLTLTQNNQTISRKLMITR